MLGVATNEADNHLPAVASTKKDKNEESHVDTFAGLAVSSSSSSSDSSSDRGTHQSKPRKQTKAKVPVKSCDCPQKQSAENQHRVSKDEQKKASLTPLQTQSASTSCLLSANPTPQVESPKQDVPHKLRKKVSFPPRLTRGQGKSYTPPLSNQEQFKFSEDTSPSDKEKSVRFSDELIRGKGPEYSDLTPRKSEKYPFITAAYSPRKRQRQPSPPAPLKSSIANPESPKSVEKKAVMGVTKPGKASEEPEKFDILSDSDDSFTDTILATPPAIGNERLRRKSTTSPRGQPLPMPTNSSVPLKYVPGRGWVQRTDAQSLIGSMDSYVDYVTAENTKRNESPELSPGLERAERERRYGAAPIPDYNSYGLQIRPNSINSSIFNGPASSRWPQPVFFMRGRKNAAVAGRPQPIDVLGERSSARNNTAATNQGATAGPSQRPSSMKQPKQSALRDYQPPSSIDADVDTTIYYDPANKRTYRDV
ncbi:MAG: hypothetical protein Q9202_000294 [Teloschistes flavicans]